MKPPANIKTILVTAFLLETLCVTFALLVPSLSGFTSIVYTASGLVIAYALLWMNRAGQPQPIHFFSVNPTLNLFRWVLMVIALLVMCKFFLQWMQDEPLSYQDADMLPIIKTMCERFLAGAWSHVYDPIPEIWGGTHPIYLPAMWLPFILPVALHIDIRWLTVMVLFLVCCIFLWRLQPLRKYAWLVCLCAFLLFWWLFAYENAALVPYTEEGIVIFYYVLLTIALMGRKAWLIALCASLCVLSRYALIGWLPAMILYYAYNKEWKNIFQFVVMGIICFVLLLLLPFGWGIFASLVKLPASYIDFTRRVWHDAPHVFMQSLGWAKFFGPQRISLQHNLLVFLSFAVPALSMIICLQLHKRNHIPIHNIPLAVLKITLVIFYSFVDVPYLYLFYTSSFVSLMAVCYFLNRNGKNRHTHAPV